MNMNELKDEMMKRYKASRSFRDAKMSPWSGEKKRKFYQWAGKRSADPVDYESAEPSSAEYWIDAGTHTHTHTHTHAHTNLYFLAEAPGEIKRGTPYQYRSMKVNCE
jgi:hypothetical protein